MRLLACAALNALALGAVLGGLYGGIVGGAGGGGLGLVVPFVALIGGGAFAVMVAVAWLLLVYGVVRVAVGRWAPKKAHQLELLASRVAAVASERGRAPAVRVGALAGPGVRVALEDQGRALTEEGDDLDDARAARARR